MPVSLSKLAPDTVRGRKRKPALDSRNTGMSLLLLALLAALTSSAESVTIAWQARPPADGVTNYVVYWGRASRQYTECASAGHNTNLTVSPGPGLWYFAVTAQNPAGESLPSAEVIYIDLRKVVTVHLQRAPYATGPWTNVAAWVFTNNWPDFFRAKLTIGP